MFSSRLLDARRRCESISECLLEKRGGMDKPTSTMKMAEMIACIVSGLTIPSSDHFFGGSEES
jgi:hypothetical protein